MTWRTPSSLKWLIVRRSRISGALLSLDAEKKRLLDRLATVEGRATALRQHLAALDHTFQLHEIQMEPAEILPVKPQRRKRLMPPGQLGRAILSELRQAADWLPSTEILARIADRINPEESDYQEIRKCLRRRLGTLARDGVLERRASLSEKGLYDGQGATLFRIANLRPNATNSASQPPRDVSETQLTLPMSVSTVTSEPLENWSSRQADPTWVTALAPSHVVAILEPKDSQSIARSAKDIVQCELVLSMAPLPVSSPPFRLT